jgi:hypothetical protein
MKKSIDEIWPQPTSRLPIVVLLLIQLTLVLLLATAGETQAAGETRYLWQSRDQFVAIQQQDSNGAAVSANDQPAMFSSDQLRAMLNELQFVEAGKEKPLPVFNEPEREILVELLREGLSTAGPQEDVTFAVIGQFPTLFGLAKERKVTTGRVFSAQGKLNIIFGIVHREINDKEDRRLAPFTPGSRSRTAKLEGRLSIPADERAAAMKRADWLTLSPKSMPAVPSKPVVSPLMTDQPEPQPPTTNRRDGMNRQATPTKQGKSAGERIKILNELKDEKLITDDEYRSKRLEILNEL